MFICCEEFAVGGVPTPVRASRCPDHLFSCSLLLSWHQAHVLFGSLLMSYAALWCGSMSDQMSEHMPGHDQNNVNVHVRKHVGMHMQQTKFQIT